MTGLAAVSTPRGVTILLPMPDTPTPAETLRERTRDCHDAVEAHVRVSEQLGERERYAELLAFFARTLAPVEAWLEGHDAPGANPQGGVAMLHADLRAVGREPADQAAAFEPGPRGEAAALGVMYVVEGSALGGQMIARDAEKNLGVTPDRGASFFARGGADGMAGWRRFKAHLNERLDTPEKTEAAVGAARATFGHFIEMAKELP